MRACIYVCIAFLHACVIFVACTCFLACLHASNCLLTCFAFTQLLLHACLQWEFREFQSLEPWIPVSVPNQIAEVYTCSLVTMQFPSVKDFSVFFYRTSKEDQLLIPCGCKKYMQEKTHNNRRCNFLYSLSACMCDSCCLHLLSCMLARKQLLAYVLCFHAITLACMLA